MSVGCGLAGGDDTAFEASAFLDLRVVQVDQQVDGLAVSEQGYAFARTTSHGFTGTWDATDPTALTELFMVEGEDSELFRTVHDGELWAAWDRIRRWDITGLPAQPPRLVQEVTGLEAGLLAFTADHLYVTDRGTTVSVFDLPSFLQDGLLENPEHRGSLSIDGIQITALLPEDEDHLWVSSVQMRRPLNGALGAGPVSKPHQPPVGGLTGRTRLMSA